MRTECDVDVKLFQNDEDESLLTSCVKKIKEYYSDDLGWDWEKIDTEEGYAAKTKCEENVGEIFDGTDGNYLLKIMRKYEVWSVWTGINRGDLSCSKIETDADGFADKPRYFSLLEAITNTDEEGAEIGYQEGDFNLFKDNIISCLKGSQKAEKPYFQKIFKEKGSCYLKLKEAFEKNYSDSSDLYDAIYEWLQEYVYPDWIN